MIEIKNKEDCCGCTACSSICPKQCIAMKEDEEGFKYPVIDHDLCINCGLCEKVCPTHENRKVEEFEIKVYITRVKNNNELERSSSGGFVSSLSQYIIDHNGYVCGVLFDEQFRVVHRLTKDKEICNKFTGSKYVQSELDGIFNKIKEKLIENETVCFIGTGCQIIGLKNYLRKNYNNLITVNLVCHGVPSPLLWKEYLSLQEKKYRSKIKSVNFRDKTFGYQVPAIKIDFSNGRRRIATARVDIMLKSFFQHASLRYSCFKCPAKGIYRDSDFTVYDCWNADKILKYDDNRGYTNVLVNTEKGKELVEELSHTVLFTETKLEDILPQKGGMLVNNAKPHPNRKEFYSLLEKDGAEEAFNKYFSLKLSDHFVELLKHFFAKNKFFHDISRKRRTNRR